MGVTTVERNSNSATSIAISLPTAIERRIEDILTDREITYSGISQLFQRRRRMQRNINDLYDLHETITSKEIRPNTISGTFKEASFKKLNDQILSQLQNNIDLYSSNIEKINSLNDFLIHFLKPEDITVYSTNSNSLFFYNDLSITKNLHLELYLDKEITSQGDELFFNYFDNGKSTQNGIGSFKNILTYLKNVFVDK